MKHPRILTPLLLASAFALAPATFAQTTPSTPTTPTATTSGTTPAMTLQPAVLPEVQVLGSRIRQTDITGPSPVSSYDKEFITSTGAMTLSDFLNQIPQTYSGISSGRASAPDEFNPDFGQRTDTTTPAFNFVLGAADQPPAQTGVTAANLRGLGSGSTLVLVDGRRTVQSGIGNRGTDTRQGFVDLNTIPLSMIERIEVTTDGASAIYGADAVGGVINIILKKNYNGTEATFGYKATEHGGGRERNSSVTSGFVSGKLSGSVTVEYFDRQNLTAADRSFSKEQNHSAIPTATITATGATRYGVDYRLNYGYPAVIQASGGVVSGTFDAIPGVRVVLVPAGAATTPTISQFIPVTTPAGTATVVNAAAQRRTNTAAYLDLVPEARRTGASANLAYKFSDRLDIYGNYRASLNHSLFRSQPAANSITGGFGSAVVVPAAFNPFNQNISLNMILSEWGTSSQKVKTRDGSATFGVRGKAFQTWQWDIGTSWQLQKTYQTTRTYNGAALSALLINADPNLRFNPFIDASAPGAPSQAAKLETLATYPSIDSGSKGTGADFSADGNLFDIWGGTVKSAFGSSINRAEVISTSINYSAIAVPVATTTVVQGAQQTTAFFAEGQIPVFGKPNALPGFRRLDVQLAGRYEKVHGYSKTVPKYGVSWGPVDSLLIRGSWSQGFRAPGVTEFLIAPSTTTSTVTDPRRTPASTPGVVVSRGSNPTPTVELSDNRFAGIVYEPKFAKGLSLQVNYYDVYQKNVLQLLSAQTIINNESLFADRITRLPATSADTALNQPGQITAVSQVFINYGTVFSRSMDYQVDYAIPGNRFGYWRVNFAATRNLNSTRRIAPGQAEVVLDGDTASPPKWKFNSSLFWRKDSWNASAFLYHLDGFNSNNAGSINVANSTAVTYYPVPGVTKIDVRAGYEFKKGIWREHGKGIRVSLGINNVADKKPPFSDSLFGFASGLHSQFVMGRTYEFSMVIPLH